MAHTHTSLLYHLVFSTKRRAPLLTAEARSAIFPYIAGIIENLGGKALIINGVEDHAHILCRLNTQTALSDALQAIKGSSSAWYSKRAERTALHWQEGYGAFTVSESQRDRVHQYIANQEEHHRRRTFAEEYEEFLTRHGIDFDRRFLLD